MRVLITGANGFLGSHLVEKSLEKGYRTTALLRPGADLANLKHLTGYKTLNVDYSSVDKLAATLKKARQQDLIIHNAGLTKSFTLDQYLKVNVGLTERFISAIKSTDILKDEGRFAYISSLAARGPVGHGGPASKYGISKAKAEETVKTSGLNFMIFRPTGIYGSRDVQFVPLIKAVKFGVYPFLTSSKHKMTLIHVRDVAENVIECSLRYTNETVHLDDGNVYLHRDLKAVLEKLLNRKSMNLTIPRQAVKGFLFLSDFFDKALDRTPRLSLEHYSEISKDWDHNYSDERKRIPLKINYPLHEGFREACFSSF